MKNKIGNSDRWQAVVEVMMDGRFKRGGVCGHSHGSEKLAEQCADRMERSDERIRKEEGLGESSKRYFAERISKD